MFTEPRKSNAGLFIVDWAENYPHWRAWREWYHEAFGKKFFPQKLTVPMAWPPESPAGAQTVADWLKDMRDGVAKEDPKQGGGPCAAIPDIVLPWRGWNDELKKDVAEAEILRRRDAGAGFDLAPKYAVRHRHGYRFQPRSGRSRAPMAAE